MTTRFLVIAAIMVVAALACVLVPLLHSARREGRPRTPFVLALVLALVTPPVVLGAYLAVGTPQALQAVPAENQATLVDATRQLQESLQRKPDDAQGWALLAQAYSALDQPQQALDALNHLLKLKPDDPDAMVAWVEATAETGPSHQIDDVSRGKLQRALQIEPTHQRALWLLGISDFQRGAYREAAATWRLLQPQLEPGSNVAKAVAEQIVVADARAGGAPAGASSSSAAATPQGATLQVQVTLAPELKDKLAPGDALFVYARAENGPPMPLAVAKLDPAQLPTTVTLSDAMAMTPAFKLSSVERVFVGARISHSGQPVAQPGDLEGDAGVGAVERKTPVKISIDKVH